MPSPYRLCVDYPPSEDCPFGSSGTVITLEKRTCDSAIVVKNSWHNNINNGDVLVSLNGVPLNGDGGVDDVVDLSRQFLKNGMKIGILRIAYLDVGNICTFVDLSTNVRCCETQKYRKGQLGLCPLHRFGICKFIDNNGKSCNTKAIGSHGRCRKHNLGPCKFIDNRKSCTLATIGAHGYCARHYYGPCMFIGCTKNAIGLHGYCFKHNYGDCTYMINNTVGCGNGAHGTHGLCRMHLSGPSCRGGTPNPGPLRLMLEKMEEFMEQLKPIMTEEQFERVDFIHRQRLNSLETGEVDPVSLNQRILALVEKETQAYFADRDNQNKWVRCRRNNVMGWEELERYVHSRAHTSLYLAFRDFLCDEIDYSALSPELMVTIMTGIVDAFKRFCRENNGELCVLKIGSSGVEGSLGLGSIRTNDTVIYPDEAFKPSSWTSLHLTLPREERYIAESFGILFAAGFGVTCNLGQPRNLIPDTDNCSTSTLYVYSSKFGSVSDHFGGYGLHRHGPHVPPGHHLVPISQLSPSDSGVSVLDTSSADDNDDGEFASEDFNHNDESGSGEEYISTTVVNTGTTRGEFSSIDNTAIIEASLKDRDKESSPTNVMDYPEEYKRSASNEAAGTLAAGDSQTATIMPLIIPVSSNKSSENQGGGGGSSSGGLGPLSQIHAEYENSKKKTEDNDDSEFASSDFNHAIGNDESETSEYISTASTTVDNTGMSDDRSSSTACLKTDDAANATESSASALSGERNPGIASVSTNSGNALIDNGASTWESSDDSDSLGGSPMANSGGQKRKSTVSEQSNIGENKSLKVQLTDRTCQTENHLRLRDEITLAREQRELARERRELTREEIALAREEITLARERRELAREQTNLELEQNNLELVRKRQAAGQPTVGFSLWKRVKSVYNRLQSEG